MFVLEFVIMTTITNLRLKDMIRFIPSPPATANTVYWYRYVDRKPKGSLSLHSGLRITNGFDANVIRLEYPVLRETPKGVVLDTGLNTRFVLNGTRKQFAHPDDKGALTSFMYRKKAQRNILRSQVDQVETALIVGQRMLSTLP